LTRSKPDEEDNARLEGLILEKMPGNPAAWRQLAARQEEMGNLHDALRTWQKCTDLAAPGSTEWEDALRWLGEHVGLRWARKPIAAGSGVAVAAGLAFTSELGQVLVLNRNTGEENWRQPARGPAICACELDGTVFCAIHGQGIAAYDSGEGTKRWAFDMTEGRFCLTAAAGRVFAAGASIPDDEAFCFDPATGQIVWQYRPSLDGYGWVRHPPIVVSDRVFLQTATAGMYALEAGTGTEIWKRESVGEDWHSYACLHHDGMLYAGTNDGIAHCVDASTGQLVWQQGLGERLRPCYVTPGGLALYTCRKKNGLFAFDAKTGEQEWAYELPRPWGATPYGNTVIVDSWDGHVFSVEAETGDVRWCLDIQPPPTIRVIDDATLYMSAGALLYAFDVGKLDRAGTEGNGVFGAH